MKPVIAKRTTKCTYCKEPIVPGSERLTDKWRIKSSRNPKGYILITKHFHFRKPGVSIDKNNCFDLYAEAYFDTIPEENRKTKSNNPRGRPPLDLSEEDRAERRRLISKIHSQLNYYIHGNKLDLTSPQIITDISMQDVRRANRFRKNMREILEGLKKVGGVPKNFQNLADTLDSNELPDKNERAARRDRVKSGTLEL